MNRQFVDRRIDGVFAVTLFAVTAVVVGVTAQELGFTRDEGYYFKAGEQYWGWFRALFTEPGHALSQAGIDQHLRYNHEHPFLIKASFALGYGMRELSGFPAYVHNALRFPAWLLAGLSTSLVFLLARSLLRRRAAVLAALLWVSIPHVFWHMHLACFDVPVAAAHTWLVLAWLKHRRTRKGAVIVGIAFGFAAAVKHNVLPVPALFVLHWLLFDDEARLRPVRIPLSFVSLALLAPLVYFVLWPYLWPDPLVRFGQYLGFHLRHEHYPILYFGDLLVAPPFPWLFPLVMSAVTIPIATVVLMSLGFVLAVIVLLRFVRIRFFAGKPREVECTQVPLGDVAIAPSASAAFLLAVNAFFPFFLIALPSTPIFGGTKHWMNALPFLCVLGAWAVEEGLARLRLDRRVFAALAIALVLPGFAITARVWPYGLGSYNELIGFSRGAANVGMQRTFWGYEVREALSTVNERTRPKGSIHFGDVNHDSWRMYRRDGLLREDISFSNTVRKCAVAHVEPQGEFKQQQIDVWNEWGTRVPDIVIHAEGVPLSTVTFAPEKPLAQGLRP